LAPALIGEAFWKAPEDLRDDRLAVGAEPRFAILFEPGELLDMPTPAVCEPEDDVPVNAGFCHNAYPFPGDAIDPEPYEPGSYPRIDAFTPPEP
jgi:hypothetical protein